MTWFSTLSMQTEWDILVLMLTQNTMSGTGTPVGSHSCGLLSTWMATDWQVHYVGILTFVGILWRVSKLYIFGNLIVYAIRKTMFPFAPRPIWPPSRIFQNGCHEKGFREYLCC